MPANWTKISIRWGSNGIKDAETEINLAPIKDLYVVQPDSDNPVCKIKNTHKNFIFTRLVQGYQSRLYFHFEVEYFTRTWSSCPLSTNQSWTKVVKRKRTRKKHENKCQVDLMRCERQPVFSAKTTLKTNHYLYL